MGHRRRNDLEALICLTRSVVIQSANPALVAQSRNDALQPRRADVNLCSLSEQWLLWYKQEKANPGGIMKRAFLISTASAIAALMQHPADAALPDGGKDQKATNSNLGVQTAKPDLAAVKDVTTYAVGSDLFGFVIECGARGEMVAQHMSHASHASHSSHYSGR